MLRRDGTDLRSVLSQPKRLALLVYLAAARPRGFHPRDTLLALFWAEADDEAARNRLRQMLHQLRRSLGEDVFPSRGDYEIGVEPTVLVCDAVKFDEAIAEKRYEEALALYGGDFMRGFFVDDAPAIEQWIHEERETRRRAAVTAAMALAERERASGDIRSALPWARAALSFAPHDENVLRLLVSLLNESGEPEAALRTFDDFARKLSDHLAVAPSAETVRLVEQIQQRGEVQHLTSAPVISSSGPQANPGSTRVKRKLFRRRYAAAGLAVVALLSAGWLARLQQPGTNSLPTIAVLPLEDLSVDARQEYFSDGITDEILTSLASINGLRVASRTSSFAFKNQRADVRTVGEKLGVENVLEGSVRRIGDRIRISLQLSNTRNGYQIWTNTYDREVGDIFEVQEEIARSVTSALAIKLGKADDAMLERRSTSSAEAYDLYLRGKHLITSRSEERNRKAIEYFEQAIATDGRFALPFAGLARAYIAMGEFVPPRTVLPHAKQAALRALQLDSSLVETRLALARVRQVYDRDWQSAEREIQRALAISPQSPAAHAALATLRLNQRRFDEAFVERQHTWKLRRASSPDTLLSSFRVEQHISSSDYYWHIRKDREALKHANAALALDPTNVTARWLKALLDQELGNYPAAIAALEIIREETNSEMPFLTHLGRAYAAAGRRKDAEAILNTLLARARKTYVPKDQIALLYFSLGDTTRALTWLERAVDDYHWWMPNANAHPLWRGLQHDPRFRSLMQKLGAPAS